MSRIIDPGLEELSTILNSMGELAYRAVSLALAESIGGGNFHSEIREISDTLVSMASKAEDRALELVVRFQPVASDLRTIHSYIKIAYDLARFGRYALDTSYTSHRLGPVAGCDTWITLFVQEMGNKTLEMVRLSLDSLRSRDIALVEKAGQIEKEVDARYFSFLEKVTGNPDASPKCVASSVLVVRYLERIADHAAYICESITYIATGHRTHL